jgi:hypothetical protein
MLTKDYFASLIRTLVPVVVGWVLAQLAIVGIDLDPGSLQVIVEALFIGGYYAIVRLLEAKNTAFGWFLGLATAPSYPDKSEDDLYLDI